MKRRAFQLSRRHRWLLFSCGLVLLVTGIVWAWVNRLDISGEASDSLRDLKPLLLKVHGFAAVGFVLLLGTLLPNHVRRSWHAHKNRGNGAFFLTVMGLLTLSGYALYYLGNDDARLVSSHFHLWLGVVTPALLIWHIRSGRAATSK